MIEAAVSLVSEEAGHCGICSLHLCNFRNHRDYRLTLDDRGGVALWGSNGCGKTNVLEAISLLQGRGMRGASSSVVAHTGCDGWMVHMQWKRDEVVDDVQLSWQSGMRRMRVNDVARTQKEFRKEMPLLWLTPDSERDGGAPPEARRRLLDHITSHFERQHESWLRSYGRLLRERSRLLRTDGDARWLTLLEERMARLNSSIAAARHVMVARLNKHHESIFPITLEMDCAVDGWLAELSALQLEERLCELWRQRREEDRLSGGSAYGVHKSDFVMRHGKSGMDGRLCSTGEQKLLTVSLVSKAVALLRQLGKRPVVLLDEAAAHLDERKRFQLYQGWDELDVQYWVTAADRHLLKDFKGTMIAMEQA